MWESFSEILTSGNACIVLAFLAFFLIIGWWLVKNGLLVIHTNTVEMGAETKERAIIQHQCEYVKNHLAALEANVYKPEGYDPFRGLYIIERMYDEYVFMITQNHIKTTKGYIHAKQENMVALVDSLTIFPEYKTEDFKEMLRKDTEKCIKMLVEIRENYSKK